MARSDTDGTCPFATQVYGATAFTTGSVDRVGFCDHTASGWYDTLTRASFWNDPRGDGTGRGKTAVHFAIARDGRIAQIENIFDTPWAQGQDQNEESVGPQSPGVTWPPFAAMGHRNPNGYLISTEHEDWTKDERGSHPVVGSQWTPEQYAADLKVKRWCVAEVKRVQGKDLLRFGYDSLAGHYMFDPVNRSGCPGKYWRSSYHDRLWADLSQETEQVFVPHSRIDHFYDTHQNFTGRIYPNAVGGFELPAGVTSIELELALAPGSAEVEVLHAKASADGTNHVGHAWHTDGGYGHGRVVLAPDGSFTLGCDGQAVLALVGCTAYYL